MTEKPVDITRMTEVQQSMIASYQIKNVCLIKNNYIFMFSLNSLFMMSFTI